jgi:hypothetical protein
VSSTGAESRGAGELPLTPALSPACDDDSSMWAWGEGGLGDAVCSVGRRDGPSPIGNWILEIGDCKSERPLTPALSPACDDDSSMWAWGEGGLGDAVCSVGRRDGPSPIGNWILEIGDCKSERPLTPALSPACDDDSSMWAWGEGGLGDAWRTVVCVGSQSPLGSDAFPNLETAPLTSQTSDL